jgi:hypothetical protein
MNYSDPNTDSGPYPHSDPHPDFDRPPDFGPQPDVDPIDQQLSPGNLGTPFRAARLELPGSDPPVQFCTGRFNSSEPEQSRHVHKA